jgi:hypothetical protein
MTPSQPTQRSLTTQQFHHRPDRERGAAAATWESSANQPSNISMINRRNTFTGGTERSVAFPVRPLVVFNIIRNAEGRVRPIDRKKPYQRLS